MTRGLAILTLIHSLLSFLGSIVVLVVGLARWSHTRQHLREGVRWTLVFLILSLPTSILAIWFIDLSGLPAGLPPLVYRLGWVAGVAGLLMLVLSSAHLVLEVAVASMAVPKEHSFPLASSTGGRFAGWWAGALVGFVGAVLSAIVFHKLNVQGGEAFRVLYRMFPRLAECSPLQATVLFVPQVLAAAVGEEILYRGVLQAWLIRWLGATRSAVGVAIATSSFFWAVPHVLNTDSVEVKLIQIFISGLAFGWLSRRYSVETSIVAHATLNLSAIVAWWLLTASSPHSSARAHPLPPPPLPAACDAANKATSEDLAAALPLSRVFTTDGWTEDRSLKASYARVTWRHPRLSAMANRDALVYPCGYTDPSAPFVTAKCFTNADICLDRIDVS
jgi:membrane protease YdiL (CAAX protease family)